jgi:hypothetical protein
MQASTSAPNNDHSLLLRTIRLLLLLRELGRGHHLSNLGFDFLLTGGHHDPAVFFLGFERPKRVQSGRILNVTVLNIEARYEPSVRVLAKLSCNVPPCHGQTTRPSCDKTPSDRSASLNVYQFWRHVLSKGAPY